MGAYVDEMGHIFNQLQRFFIYNYLECNTPHIITRPQRNVKGDLPTMFADSLMFLLSISVLHYCISHHKWAFREVGHISLYVRRTVRLTYSTWKKVRSHDARFKLRSDADSLAAKSSLLCEMD